MSNTNHSMEPWDPLASDSDPGIIVAAQRREIRNILKSYTGYYDLFSELIQNALDAVERRSAEEESDYLPSVHIHIDIPSATVAVIDNGCGMTDEQFKQFLRPNFSFKSGEVSRGSKGVGATYLGYGFNYLEVATKFEGKMSSGVIKRGREWVEDKTESISRPRVEPHQPSQANFNEINRGSSMVVKLTGAAIRPRNLSWIGASTAEQWLAILSTDSPLGGVYLCDDKPLNVMVTLEVVDANGTLSTLKVNTPEYLYPSHVYNRVADITEYRADIKDRVAKGKDLSKIPPKFKSLNGIWGEWSGDEILDPKSECPIVPRLDESERALVHELGLKIKIFLAFSTDLWDSLNDKKLGLRKGHRLLHGGLQICTRHMVQGPTLTIPMTNNIGFQNLAHVLVHFENAEPDLGRKGFQPDQVRVAEKLSVSAVTAMRKYYSLLRKPGGAKDFSDELKLNAWKDEQLEHEKDFPLVIKGTGLFLPTEELPIRSEPLVEQDVVALFNQMLSSGIVRGIQLISSSQYKQYDGLFRVIMEKPFDRFILSGNNPLGIDDSHFIDQESLQTIVKILEYKYTIDGLVEELQTEVKAIEDVDLVVAWELGEKWRAMFDVTSFLDEDNNHHRTYHGLTHSFTHSMNGNHAFNAIILKDLVAYLVNPEDEQARQRDKLNDDD